MLRHLIAFPTLALALAAGADRPIKVVLVGDSTVNDEGGWGAGFRASFGPRSAGCQPGAQGRSSKSFRDEGAWAKVMPEKPNYVLIQFGHNDCPARVRSARPTRHHLPRQLERYVEKCARAAPHPSWSPPSCAASSMPKANSRSESLVPSMPKPRAGVAAERKTPLIDLYTLTKASRPSSSEPRAARPLAASTHRASPTAPTSAPRARRKSARWPLGNSRASRRSRRLAPD